MRQAKQLLSSCVEARSAAVASDAASSWLSLQRLTDTQLTDSQVGLLSDSDGADGGGGVM